ncbi:hypothetical protein D5081_06035 [Pectobacterium carotovorum]|nr:hypothetical protein D5083_14970 [Pectobacterium carotovorum]RJL44001.1 hypothetical protein D5081_06035 [Pectobacterium carotovorum]
MRVGESRRFNRRLEAADFGIVKRHLGVTPSSNQRDPKSDHQVLPMQKENRMRTGKILHVKVLNKMIKTKIPLKFP